MDDKNLKTLKTFHDGVKKLCSNQSFYTDVSLQLNCKEGEGLIMRSSGPDNHVTKAFILDIRHFIAEESPINFYKICNLIYQNNKNEKILEEVKKCREAWSKILEKKKGSSLGGMRLKIDNDNLTAEHIMDLYFNAEFFHLDETRRDFLEKLRKTPMGPFTFFAFVDLIQKMGQLLFYFDGKVITPTLEENN